MNYPSWIYRKANVHFKRGRFITKVSIEDIEYAGRWYHHRLWQPTEERVQVTVDDARAGMILMKQREFNVYFNPSST